MKKIVIGILAHVDAGKTTLSESMLYAGGSIRKMGRVDNGDAFLDNHRLERARGITIFSKQAVFSFQDMEATLLDTPGHVDFSAEMERTLQVLDYAILVINGSDSVQGHTNTLWHLLKKYKVPVFLFINKMDQKGTDRGNILEQLKSRLDENCMDFGEEAEDFYENLALCGETALEHFLDTGKIEEEEIASLILQRKVFPCFFGSALKSEGVGEFMQGLSRYTRMPSYPEEFGAKVFKIARDGQGNRLTYMKITGGSLKIRQQLGKQKVNQIRMYSGEKYMSLESAQAGTVCAVTGLGDTYPGEGLGMEMESAKPLLEPVLTYQLRLPEGCNEMDMLAKLRQLEEEEPELHIMWEEHTREILVQIMGEVQTEILKGIIAERYGAEVEFDKGNILYKETIGNTVEGVGHFEPLRHYAEVHLLLEPGERGNGLEFYADCSEDVLDRNWQRLVLSQLAQKEHKGVLTGSPVTDMKITLVAGKGHQKHTEGGDFREAAFRALRQGLKQAMCILLEPYYEFSLEVPKEAVGRAMADLEKMHGSFELKQQGRDAAALTGTVPVVTMREYQKEVTSYTKGMGRLSCNFKGYFPCHNTQEVIREKGYDSDRDIQNPADSVFCAHGAGFTVSWDRAAEFMHVECRRKAEKAENGNEAMWNSKQSVETEASIGEDEIEAILTRTYYANKSKKTVSWKKKSGGKTEIFSGPSDSSGHLHLKSKPEETYLLVDGYNIIFAWDDLKELAKTSIDGARGRLMDILCNYQAIEKCNLILVFDAYRVEGHNTEHIDYNNIHVVYTKEAETADQYIERFAHENGRKKSVRVATSDGLEQIIIRGQGCRLLSARELKIEIEAAEEKNFEEYQKNRTGDRHYLKEMLEEAQKKMGKIPE